MNGRRWGPPTPTPTFIGGARPVLSVAESLYCMSPTSAWSLILQASRFAATVNRRPDAGQCWAKPVRCARWRPRRKFHNSDTVHFTSLRFSAKTSLDIISKSYNNWLNLGILSTSISPPILKEIANKWVNNDQRNLVYRFTCINGHFRAGIMR